MPYSVPLARIPITPAQNQSHLINLNGTDYRMRFLWNDEGPAWVLDIGDAQGTPLVCGIALVPGINMLEQYEYLQIGRGGALFMFGHDQKTGYPTFYNLGSEWQVYFGFPTSFGSKPLAGLSTVPQEVMDAFARPPLTSTVTFA